MPYQEAVVFDSVVKFNLSLNKNSEKECEMVALLALAVFDEVAK